MGNISAIIVVCSVCGALILILAIAFKIVSKKSSNNKLDDEINKYKNLNNGVEEYSSHNDNNQIKSQIEKKEEKIIKKTQKLQKKLDNQLDLGNLEENNAKDNVEIDNSYDFSTKAKDTMFNAKETAEKKCFSDEEIEKRDKEFEDFMNEFSYSRVVGNKKLLNQIKNLPPKVKALVLGNIFNKFED